MEYDRKKDMKGMNERELDKYQTLEQDWIDGIITDKMWASKRSMIVAAADARIVRDKRIITFYDMGD